jgi:hypothetical protein
MVDKAKFVVIDRLPPLVNVKEVYRSLGHAGNHMCEWTKLLYNK